MNFNRWSTSMYFYGVGALVGLLLATIGITRIYALRQSAENTHRESIEQGANSVALAREDNRKDKISPRPLETASTKQPD